MTTHETVTCDNCGCEELVDVSDLQDFTEEGVARRANFAVSDSDILCPGCFDELNPFVVQ